jgi:exodeoxyribonuclease VII small subunit
MAKAKKAASPDPPSFETALQRLEEIVRRLEDGEISLDESLSLFEEGIRLTRYCSDKLDAAEGKLEILLGFDGKEPETGAFMADVEESR